MRDARGAVRELDAGIPQYFRDSDRRAAVRTRTSGHTLSDARADPNPCVGDAGILRVLRVFRTRLHPGSVREAILA